MALNRDTLILPEKQMSKNFGHLKLIDFLSEKETALLEQRLDQAERLWKFSPVGAAINCRISIEYLLDANIRLCDNKINEDTKNSLMRSLVSHYQNLSMWDASACWERLRKQYHALSAVIHGEIYCDDIALINLRDFHGSTLMLLKDLIPNYQAKPWSIPEDIADTYAAAISANKNLEALLNSARNRSQEAEQVRVDTLREFNWAKEAVLTANTEVDNLQMKLLEANQRIDTSEIAIYKELLNSSEKNATALVNERVVREKALASALAITHDANLQLAVLGREIDQLKLSAELNTVSLVESQTEIARARRYPTKYPGFDGASQFFLESLFAPQSPMAPFIGVEGILELKNDLFAKRYQAYLNKVLCTIRIIRADENDRTSDDCKTAWEIESENAIKLRGTPGSIGLATVLTTGNLISPGFTVFNRTDGHSLASEVSQHIKLPQVMTIVKSFLDALEERLAVRIVALLPDADAIAIRGCVVTLQEPTSVHPGDLSPPEFAQLHPGDVGRLTLNELKTGWVFAAALTVKKLLPGFNTIGSISFSARRSDSEFSDASIQTFADLIDCALLSSPQQRPTLEEFRAVLNRNSIGL